MIGIHNKSLKKKSGESTKQKISSVFKTKTDNQKKIVFELRSAQLLGGHYLDHNKHEQFSDISMYKPVDFTEEKK